jgi:hypothetical protein
MSRAQPRKLKGAGKPKLTSADGLRFQIWPFQSWFTLGHSEKAGIRAGD